ncbi:MAG: hypothetical protein E6I13_09945 [Chloroflexi bacterium]|nr:MAG: hypothetical protein E6I13_09945 [Chloroflexota bacterium]
MAIELPTPIYPRSLIPKVAVGRADEGLAQQRRAAAPARDRILGPVEGRHLDRSSADRRLHQERPIAVRQPDAAAGRYRARADLDPAWPQRAGRSKHGRSGHLHGQKGGRQTGQRLVPRTPGPKQQSTALSHIVGERVPLAFGQRVGREVVDREQVERSQHGRRV